MPGMDGTGPFGEGPATGWGRGRCVGGRSGFCRAYADEKSVLTAQKAALERRLDYIKSRLGEK